MNSLPGDLFAKIVAICQPFKAGNRFRAMPGVQLWVPGGKVDRLAAWLPDPEETEPDYVERLRARQIDSFALRIVEPWADDPTWWSWMRDLVEPIWQERGRPVLPVDVELVWSHGLVPQVSHAPDQESFVWLLDGDLESGRPQDVTRLDPGADLPWVGAPSATWLRMLVGTDGRRVVAEAAEEIAGELDSALETSATPYVPWTRGDQEIEPYREAASRVSSAVADPSHPRRLMAQWLKRCSSGGLEPVPYPRQRLTSTDPDERLRRTTTVLHATVGPELLCAANGHLFAVRDPSLGELIRQINATTAVSASELSQCWPAPVVSAVLDRLFRIHALEVDR